MVATLKAPPVSSPSRVVRGSGNKDDDVPDFDVPTGKFQKKATMEVKAAVQLGFHDFSDNSLLCKSTGLKPRANTFSLVLLAVPCFLQVYQFAGTALSWWMKLLRSSNPRRYRCCQCWRKQVDS